jgi:hypothetical protein
LISIFYVFNKAYRYLASCFFVTVAYGQQHVLGEIQVAAFFTVVFQDVGFNDGVHRAAFFAEAAEDAFGQINIVAGGAAAAVRAYFALNSNRHRGTHGLAQFAGDAALFAVFIAA